MIKKGTWVLLGTILSPGIQGNWAFWLGKSAGRGGLKPHLPRPTVSLEGSHVNPFLFSEGQSALSTRGGKPPFSHECPLQSQVDRTLGLAPRWRFSARPLARSLIVPGPPELCL